MRFWPLHKKSSFIIIPSVKLRCACTYSVLQVGINTLRPFYTQGVDQEGVSGSLSLPGVFFGVCAAACVALNAIYTKRTLPVVDQDIWSLQFYNNLNAVLLFLPLMIVCGEVPVLMAFENLFSARFMGMCTIAGICGFAIGKTSRN